MTLTISEMEAKLELLQKTERRAQKRMRAILDRMPDMIWASDSEGGGDYHSRAWLDCTGQTYEEAQGMGWLEALHPDDRAHVKAEWEKFIARHIPALRLMYRVRDAQAGKDAYVEVVGWGEVLTNGHNEVVGFVGTCTRITDAERIVSMSKAQSNGR